MTSEKKEMKEQVPSFAGKKALVVGLGISGFWAAQWLKGNGADVTLSDIRPEAELDQGYIGRLRELNVDIEAGGHKKETFLNTDAIIISPGVPADMEVIRSAEEKGIPLMGEMELAGQLIDTPVIAVTGTNGKSTVTTFLGSLIQNTGLKVFVGGNIGMPLIAYAARKEKADYAVVEVSSFQLDTSRTFSPFVSIILNITPDHLDRYKDYESYVQSKLRIFKNQGAGEYVVLNDEDMRLSLARPQSRVSVLSYGLRKKNGRHAYIEDNRICACLDDGKSFWFSLESFRLPGKHNIENLMAGVLAGLIIGIDNAVIQETINSFKGLPDRLEHVCEYNGIVFYNDSKATNVDAAAKDLASLDRPLILIAGGRDKGTDYSPLTDAARGKVKKAVFIGEAKEVLAASFDGVIPFSMAGDMFEAVSIAGLSATRGDAVLLAPACSSLDMFTDFSHRGRVFKEAVMRIAHG
ncbi:MAG: UDP-N-acetylmuramoyl-L-alanine--D-glutamate ligase [Deltaproteobacteria bacterium]|nr:UDP-N-acetylmuramoyl-L-alanine--D-glutamate ligase [Deltaproteobacteria bacterium]